MTAALQTAAQTWKQGSTVAFSLAANTFTDSQNQTLTFAATQANGTTLPSWLHFNAATDSFSGTVPTGTNGLSLKVTATDTSGVSASETFAVTTPALPVVSIASQTAAQTWKQGSAISFTVASNTFADSQNLALTYTASQANGSALPTWLTFNAATRTFSGAVPANVAGLSLKVTATDASGISASEIFAVNTPVTPAMRAAGFLNTLGVNTHIPYTDGEYSNITMVAADLAYLGINQVRDSISNGANGSAPYSSYVALAQDGIHFTFLASGSTTAALQGTLSEIAALNQAVKGSVTAVEGPNEINNWPVTYNGVGGLQGAVNMQSAIYASVHSNALAGVAVDYFTGYGAGGVGNGPNPLTTSGLADFDTQHPYPQGGQAPAAWINPASVLTNETGTVGPSVYTETGYSTNGTGWDVVNQDVQAKYTLDLLLDAAKDGVSKTYLYQLMDAYAPGSRQGDDGYGLFDPTTAPKEAATAIHNLTAILQDNGTNAASFVMGSLAYTIQGLPSTGNSMLLEKSTGAYDLAIWNEPQIWNASTKQEITVAPTTISVVLGATAGKVEVFDPLASAAPIQILTNVNTITLGVTDHPLIIEVEPATVTPAPVVSVTAQTAAQSWKQGTAVAFSLASTTFSDSQHEVLSYSASQANGSALPAWLTFNIATESFSGTVPNSANGLSIKVTATDTSGVSASETFAVTTPAQAPVVTTQTSGQVWMTNQAVNFKLAANTFTDPQGDSLTYSADQVGATSATSWLKFNAATQTFSGTAPAAASGPIQLEVIATNSAGIASAETFNVTMASTAAQFSQAISSLASSTGSASAATAALPPVSLLHALSSPVA